MTLQRRHTASQAQPQPRLVPPIQRGPDRPSRNRSLRAFAIVLGLGVILAAAIFIFMAVRRRAGHAFSVSRDYIITALQDHYNADVQLGKVAISVYPSLQVHGEDLVIRSRMQPTEVPAFITVRRFSAEGKISGLLHDTIRIDNLKLEGLAINVPPRRAEPHGQRVTTRRSTVRKFIIDDLYADGAILRIYSRKPGKEPMEFDIQRLRLRSAGTSEPMRFEATVTNPKPPGTVISHGSFGPWRTDAPSLTPLSGDYTFTKADLSVFKGISGILASEGTYSGVLDHINITGRTDTPDFTVGTSGQPVRLQTEFSAVVDGTNGETLLEPVKAHFLNSTLIATGVVNRRSERGKTIELTVNSEQARIEDLVRLAARGDPPLIGAADLNSHFLLPPGKEDVIRKLRLNGQFSLTSARFTDPAVQSKILALSRRGLGTRYDEEKSVPAGNPVSKFQGVFELQDGAMQFTWLSFEVPGANVILHGTYGLRNSDMDFRGDLRLKAKPSETTSGLKSLLLRPIDPLLKRGRSGTDLPIEVTGSRGHPHFGLAKSRLLPGVP